MTVEKISCRNCKHFIKHYIWNGNKFCPVNCGHCIKRDITKKEYSRFPYENGCELWEQNIIDGRTKEDTQIIAAMLRMSKQMEEIIKYIKANNRE